MPFGSNVAGLSKGLLLFVAVANMAKVPRPCELLALAVTPPCSCLHSSALFCIMASTAASASFSKDRSSPLAFPCELTLARHEAFGANVSLIGTFFVLSIATKGTPHNKKPRAKDCNRR